MKHIYLFSLPSKGSTYGVGTYIKNMLSVVRNENFVFHVVLLHSEDTAVSVQIVAGTECIAIPNPVLVPVQAINNTDYYTNAVRILRKYIDPATDNIFHLNFLDSLALAEAIKRYLNGKIVLTIHYSQSILNLKGDTGKLYEIMELPDDADLDDTARYVRKEVTGVRLMQKHLDKVISVARHAYIQNKRLYEIEDGKHTLIYNTLIDAYPKGKISKRKLRNTLGIGANEKIIVYAGRLDEMKGVQCLLQALAILKKKGIKFHLFIAGEGHYDATIAFVKDLWTNITFTGFLDRDLLYPLFAASDIGVFPSLYDEFGYVPLEMMMFGLPVVAFDSSGPAEIIENGRTGILANLSLANADSSIRMIAEKIEYLLDNPIIRRQMGRAGRKRFLTHFSSKIFQEKMISLYKSL